jgi:hypothetical protein
VTRYVTRRPRADDWDEDLDGEKPTGSVTPSSATVEGEQRVLRRLLTNPGSYIWHLEYGAGLPQHVGQPEVLSAINSLMSLAEETASLPATDLQAILARQRAATDWDAAARNRHIARNPSRAVVIYRSCI